MITRYIYTHSLVRSVEFELMMIRLNDRVQKVRDAWDYAISNSCELCLLEECVCGTAIKKNRNPRLKKQRDVRSISNYYHGSQLSRVLENENIEDVIDESGYPISYHTGKARRNIKKRVSVKGNGRFDRWKDKGGRYTSSCNKSSRKAMKAKQNWRVVADRTLDEITNSTEDESGMRELLESCKNSSQTLDFGLDK